MPLPYHTTTCHILLAFTMPYHNLPYHVSTIPYHKMPNPAFTIPYPNLLTHCAFIIPRIITCHILPLPYHIPLPTCHTPPPPPPPPEESHALFSPLSALWPESLMSSLFLERPDQDEVAWPHCCVSGMCVYHCCVVTVCAVRIWHLCSGACIRVIRTDRPINCLDFNKEVGRADECCQTKQLRVLGPWW